MKLPHFLYFTVPFLGLALTSCVVPGYYDGRTGSAIGVRYQTYETLPRGYIGDAYYYGGRYYSGGRYERGRYYDHGREYSDRYYHAGQYYYGGHHEHYAGYEGSQRTGYFQIRRSYY